jgi:hypothetical protein
MYSFTGKINPKSSSVQMIDEVEVEVYFYEESEFRTVLENTIDAMNSNPDPQKIIVQKAAEPGVYGLSDPLPAGDDPGTERCADCGPTVDEVMHQLSGDPCWWLVEMSNGVWGWNNGC